MILQASGAQRDMLGSDDHLLRRYSTVTRGYSRSMLNNTDVFQKARRNRQLVGSPSKSVNSSTYVRARPHLMLHTCTHSVYEPTRVLSQCASVCLDDIAACSLYCSDLRFLV